MIHLVARMRLLTTFTTRYFRCSLTHSYYTKKYLIAISYCIHSYNVDKVPLVGYVAFHSITGNKMGHQETLF